MRISLPPSPLEYVDAILHLNPPERRWVFGEIVRRSRLRKASYCQTVLLSYPRSGNHLVRFLLESTFLAPSLGASDSEHYVLPRGLHDLPLFLRVKGIKPSTNQPIVTKRHVLKPADNFKRIVLLVRDPVEAILSHLQGVPDKDFNLRSEAETNQYVEVLKSWQNFSPHDRFLIEFESVLAGRREEVRALAKFLGAQGAKLNLLDTAVRNRDVAKNALARSANAAKEPYSAQFPSRAKQIRKLLKGSIGYFDDAGYFPASLFQRG